MSLLCGEIIAALNPGRIWAAAVGSYHSIFLASNDFLSLQNKEDK